MTNLLSSNYHIMFILIALCVIVYLAYGRSLPKTVTVLVFVLLTLLLLCIGMYTFVCLMIARYQGTTEEVVHEQFMGSIKAFFGKSADDLHDKINHLTNTSPSTKHLNIKNQVPTGQAVTPMNTIMFDVPYNPALEAEAAIPMRIEGFEDSSTTGGVVNPLTKMDCKFISSRTGSSIPDGYVDTGAVLFSKDGLLCNGGTDIESIKQAEAVALLKDGRIDDIRMLDMGAGYTDVPEVEVSGGGGTGAIASASINDVGQVITIQVISGGSGYVETPTVRIASPIGTTGDVESCKLVCR